MSEQKTKKELKKVSKQNKELDIQEGIKEIKNNSKDRKFNEAIDVIINLKNLDLKKTENKVDLFIKLPNGLGKKKKICAFIGPESKDGVKEADKIILAEELIDYQKDKKLAKKLSNEYDYFMAQGDMMAKVAGALGRVFGPRGKMPNPKAGAVFPPKTDVTPLIKKLKDTIRLQTKDKLIIQTKIGTKKMDDKEIIDNFKSLFNALLHSLPNEKNNIKSVFIKTTMGKPIKVTI